MSVIVIFYSNKTFLELIQLELKKYIGNIEMRLETKKKLRLETLKVDWKQ